MTDTALADRFAIHELLGLYGHIIDAAEWHRLDELFADDILFDASAFDGADVTNGLHALHSYWSAPDTPHPFAHHATNIVITSLTADRAEVLSKGIGVGRKGRVGSVTYQDILRKEPAGWRIAQRIARPRSD